MDLGQVAGTYPTKTMTVDPEKLTEEVSLSGNSYKRIGILIGSLEQGGAQRMALRLLDGLERLGYDVHLIMLDGTREVSPHGAPERASELSCRLIRLSALRADRGTIAKVFSAPRQWFALQNALRKLRCDVVISFMERANIFNLATLGSRQRVICIRKHFSMAMANKSRLKRSLVKLLYSALLKRSDVVNFNASRSAADFKSWFAVDADKISVIYNYCEPDLLRLLSREAVPEEYASVLANPVIVTSGRLLPVKGQKYLIRAFNRLKAEVEENMQLVILGEGPERDNLTALTRDLAIQECVHLPGYRSNPYTWLTRGDIFVLPSLAEGFPNALLEAMALGLPVIATDCPSGPRELLTNADNAERCISDVCYAEYGVLVGCPQSAEFTGHKKNGQNPQCSIEDRLFAALKELYLDLPKRQSYGRVAAARAAQFSFDKFFSRWRQIIHAEPEFRRNSG